MPNLKLKIHLLSHTDPCVTHETPNEYKYEYVLPIPARVTYVTFKLRASNDGHIALSAEPNDLPNMYEIGKLI